MTNPVLHEPRLKLQRAHSTLQELHAALDEKLIRFIAASTAENPKRVRLIFLEPPAEGKILIGEIAYQLRSCLDVAAVKLALHNGANGVSGVYFPIGSSENDWNSTSDHAPRAKMAKLSRAAQDVIDNLKPYEGGNDLLAGLSRICNADKHLRLVTVASSLTVTNLIGTDPNGRASPYDSYLSMASDDDDRGSYFDGLEVDVSGTDDDLPKIIEIMNEHIRFPTDVAFKDIGFFEDEYVIEVLLKIYDLVREVLDQLEATTA